MKKVVSLFQVAFLVSALSFAAAVTVPAAIAETAVDPTWCEENHPGNPQCLDGSYRNSSGGEDGGCANLGCPSWEVICCITTD